jgi:hypothetical protein
MGNPSSYYGDTRGGSSFLLPHSSTISQVLSVDARAGKVLHVAFSNTYAGYQPLNP